jgi:hypothetical protein
LITQIIFGDETRMPPIQLDGVCCSTNPHKQQHTIRLQRHGSQQQKPQWSRITGCKSTQKQRRKTMKAFENWLVGQVGIS